MASSDGPNPRRLRDACERGDLAAVNAEIAKGVDVNDDCGASWTALHRAAERGRLPVVRALLQAGADGSMVTKTGGTTALALAAERGYVEVVRELMKWGAAPPESAAGAASIYSMPYVRPDGSPRASPRSRAPATTTVGTREVVRRLDEERWARDLAKLHPSCVSPMLKPNRRVQLLMRMCRRQNRRLAAQLAAASPRLAARLPLRLTLPNPLRAQLWRQPQGTYRRRAAGAHPRRAGRRRGVAGAGSPPLHAAELRHHQQLRRGRDAARAEPRGRAHHGRPRRELSFDLEPERRAEGGCGGDGPDATGAQAPHHKRRGEPARASPSSAGSSGPACDRAAPAPAGALLLLLLVHLHI